MPKKLSKYWKCQLLGWGILGALEFTQVYQGSNLQGALRESVHTMVLGILFSHLMCLAIRKLKLTERSIWKRLLAIMILTAFFGISFGIFDHTIDEISGIWNNNSMSQNAQLLIESAFSGGFLFTGWNIIYFIYKNQQRNKKKHE